MKWRVNALFAAKFYNWLKTTTVQRQ